MTLSSHDGAPGQEHELRQLINLVPQIIMILDGGGKHVFANQRLLDYRGLTLEQWLADDDLTTVIHPDDFARVTREVRGAIAVGSEWETELRTRGKDRLYRWFHYRWNPFRTAQGEVVRWYVTATDVEDRKQTEQQLRLIIDAIPALVWSSNPDNSGHFANQRWWDYTGRSEAVADGTDWQSVAHPDDVASHGAAWAASLASGDPFEHETRFRRADGEYRWFLVRGVPLRDERGAIARWFGTCTDIEDRRRAERALLRSEEYFRRVIETIPAMVATWRPNGEMDYINRAWAEYLGADVEDMQGWGWKSAVHPDDLEQITERHTAALAAGVPVEYEVRIRRADGEYRWFLNRHMPMRGESGTILRWYVASTDVEAIKRAERSLRLSEERWRAVFANSVVGIGIADPSGRFVAVNSAFHSMLGYTEAEFLTLSVQEITHEADRGITEALVTELFSGKRRSWEMVKRHRHKDGRLIWVNFSGSVVAASGSTPALLVGIVQDITDRKRAEDDLQQTQTELARVARVTALGELSASIAHEINQPLAAIVANASACLNWLASDSPSLEHVREALADLVKDGNRAADVLSRIRALLSRSAVPRGPCRLTAIVEDSLALVRTDFARFGIIWHTSFSAEAPMVFCDKVQVQQVLLNLLMNAAEACREVTAERRRLSVRTAVEYRNGGPWSVVEVEDSGIGLSEPDTSRLFEAFYSTKPGGLGMGLSISRSIIESHGGRLWATPNAKHGATFHLSLPGLSAAAPLPSTRRRTSDAGH
jgi:PAS domain S-box-containing protein